MYLRLKSDKIKRKKFWIKQPILKRQIKREFGKLIGITWSRECFQEISLSFDCTMFAVIRKSKDTLSIISFFRMKDVCHTCLLCHGSHICSLTEVNCYQTICSNTLKQFVDKKPTNCLSMFDHFVGLALKGLSELQIVESLYLIGS